MRSRIRTLRSASLPMVTCEPVSMTTITIWPLAVASVTTSRPLRRVPWTTIVPGSARKSGTGGRDDREGVRHEVEQHALGAQRIGPEDPVGAHVNAVQQRRVDVADFLARQLRGWEPRRS